MAKRQTAMRLSEKDERLLEALSDKKGVNKTAIVILAIREMAGREGVTVPDVVEKKDSE